MSFVERDWMEYANCVVDKAEDTSFIRKPDELTERRWARTCAQCQVFNECVAWANDNDVNGVYVAGEWRD